MNQLRNFQRNLSGIRVLDPACGCGNFLVVSYREIRQIELDCIKRIRKIIKDAQQEIIAGEMSPSIVNVDQFYGIEIEGFPARIAEVALYLVDHQANMALSDELGQYLPRIPLRTSPHIWRENALRLDWPAVLKPSECSYIVGNPPFRGKKTRSAQQQADMGLIFGGWKSAGNLDYVACWYKKTLDYVSNTSIEAALVSTNSICQGEQVSLLWPRLLENGLHINFAHRTFEWTSEARGRAAVHVIIIGFSGTGANRTRKFLYDHPNLDGSLTTTVPVTTINPYLVDGPPVVVT
ncbi:MAG: DNA methyltransferase, partial [Candidatus Acidiferrales bacterium]